MWKLHNFSTLKHQVFFPQCTLSLNMTVRVFCLTKPFTHLNPFLYLRKPMNKDVILPYPWGEWHQIYPVFLYNICFNTQTHSFLLKVIALVLISIGVYSRIVKHGKCVYLQDHWLFHSWNSRTEFTSSDICIHVAFLDISATLYGDAANICSFWCKSSEWALEKKLIMLFCKIG